MIHGLQSVGITTNFNLEQAFELGQIEIYENIEGTPDVEVTLEKVLDGYPLIYHMASSGETTQSGASGIAARAKARCDVTLGIFEEAENNINNNAATVEVLMTGMYISSVSYSLSTDSSFTESVTLVGNNKEWLYDAVGPTRRMTTASTFSFDGNDSPFFGAALSPSGGVQRREDFIMSGCILPVQIQGVEGTGYGNAAVSATENRVHLQSVSISTDFSRDDVLELGNKTPYYRPANFPIEVTCDIEAITVSGDFVGAYELGDPAFNQLANSGDNLSNGTIFILTRNGYAWDLGDKNKISSVSYGGGDAGGGNVTTTYSFTNFNELDVQDINIMNGVNLEGYLGKGYLKGEGKLPDGYDWAFKAQLAQVP
jgi:hypothetical protein